MAVFRGDIFREDKPLFSDKVVHLYPAAKLPVDVWNGSFSLSPDIPFEVFHDVYQKRYSDHKLVLGDGKEFEIHLSLIRGSTTVKFIAFPKDPP